MNILTTLSWSTFAIYWPIMCTELYVWARQAIYYELATEISRSWEYCRWICPSSEFAI